MSHWTLSYPTGETLTFGRASDPISCEKFPQVSEVELRKSTLAIPGSNGTHLGHDHTGTFSVEFSLVSWEGSQEAVDAFSRHWAIGQHLRSGQLAKLVFVEDGKTRTVYGRCRGLKTNADKRLSGIMRIGCTFESALSFISVNEGSAGATAVIPLTAASVTGGGFIFPLTFPAATTGTSTASLGSLIVPSGGSYVTISVTGAVSGVSVKIGERVVNLALVAPGETITIDARPGMRGVYSSTRGAIPAVLGAQSTQLSEWRLPEGAHGITVTGNATSSSAQVIVTAYQESRSF